VSVSIEFTDRRYAPLLLDDGAALSERLNVLNSPLLFGCRMGICGTCAIRLDVMRGSVAPPGAEERETLELVAPGDPRARLACQLTATADLRIERLV
jgi:ferredoxin